MTKPLSAEGFSVLADWLENGFPDALDYERAAGLLLAEVQRLQAELVWWRRADLDQARAELAEARAEIEKLRALAGDFFGDLAYMDEYLFAKHHGTDVAAHPWLAPFCPFPDGSPYFSPDDKPDEQ